MWMWTPAFGPETYVDLRFGAFASGGGDVDTSVHIRVRMASQGELKTLSPPYEILQADEFRLQVETKFVYEFPIRIRILQFVYEFRPLGSKFVYEMSSISFNSYTKFVYELISSIRLYEISSIRNSSRRNPTRIRIGKRISLIKPIEFNELSALASDTRFR